MLNHCTRRNLLRYFAAAAAALPMAADDHANQMPGRPASSSGDNSKSAGENIMAIAAHPGDGFFAMGAPVALEVSLGGQGTFLSLSLGERGSESIPAARYGELQREASQRAARMMGAQTSFLTWPDGEIPVNEEIKFAVCDLIRQYRPSIIVTHWKGSWHKDHKACYEVVNDAIFYAGLPAIARQSPAHAVTKLYYADNWEDADGFLPETYLDITPVFERWSDACAVFPMWRGENGFRYNDYYRSLAVARGCVGGSRYAVALMPQSDQLVRHVHAL
jgi:LmbE family N-acetylglucosaminyl deacetylase